MKKLDMINKVNQNDDAFSGIIAFLIGFFCSSSNYKGIILDRCNSFWYYCWRIGLFNFF